MAAPPLRYDVITSQKTPATATKPRVKTSVLTNGIASQWTTACASRSQKKLVAQKAVVASALSAPDAAHRHKRREGARRRRVNMKAERP